MKRIVIALIAFACFSATLAAESPQEAFVKAWMGRPVVVRAELYSLVYNERGKLGKTRHGMRDGLVVATPPQGMYFQFDGRQGRDTVTTNDPLHIVSAINTAYEPDSLDVRTYRKVEPITLNRFDPGVELVVSGVRFDPDQVKVEFAQPGGGKEAITSIRVKWPLPLSNAFTERALVEDLLRRFVEVK